MNIFETVRLRKPKRNTFNLSHEVKMSGNMGKLMPFLCMPVMPYDKVRVNTETLLRYAPMIAPIMHRVNVYTHFFFVPNRLVWDNWETFVTGGEDGMQTAVMPTFSFKGDSEDYPMFTRLADYLGVNTASGKLSESAPISQLPFRAYQLIYNEYYRDQNLTDPIDIHKESDGNIDIDEGEIDYGRLLELRTRAWEKDYFTSALPWTQRGPDVTLPVSGYVDINPAQTQSATKFKLANNATGDPGSNDLTMKYSDNTYKHGTIVDYDNQGVIIDNSNNLVGDLSATSVTINELRRANALQRWYEKNARGGSRYIEQILSHFGVRSSDARLQRPEFLGGGKSPVVISEVLQTSESQTTPQGNMSGHGISANANHAFVRSFEEHGYIIGIMSVMPKSCYQQGLPRHFSIADKFDLPWPEFGHLGEQEILNKEVYNLDSDDKQDEVFGYTPRYAEYKYHPSRVAGDFKNTLNFWHIGRIFNNRPALNYDFVTAKDSNMNRIFAVQDTEQDHLWIQIYNDIKAIRPLPKYGTPSM